VEAAPANANLQSTQCTTSKATSQSVIQAYTGLATACIGMDAASNFANTTSPSTCNTPVPVTSLTVLGSTTSLMIGNPGTTPPSGLQLTVSNNQAATMTFNGISGDSDDYQSVNTNALGSATSGILTQLVAALPNSLYLTVGGVPVLGNTQLSNAVAGLLSGLLTLVSPVLNSLDALLVPLLQLLGVQIGVATVHDLGLSCGQAQLVY
jgi:uncharacterized membrane protein